jgi:hypothetical protein
MSGQLSCVVASLKAKSLVVAVAVLWGCDSGDGTDRDAGYGGSMDGGGGGLADSGAAAETSADGGSPSDSGREDSRNDGAAGQQGQRGDASGPDGVSGDGGRAEAGGDAGAAVCTSTCTIGSFRCGPFAQVVSCQSQNDGCSSWSATTTCATDQACHRLPAPACFDPRWAQWIVPNCAVDVGKGAPHPTQYTDGGDGTVVDDVTHLMWQKTIDGTNTGPPPRYGLPTALGYCGSLRLAGYDDWRLPSVVELQSIIDYGHTKPSIDSTAFPNTPAGLFWTSTAMVNPVGWAWIVLFDDARTTQARSSEETYSYVRCVR